MLKRISLLLGLSILAVACANQDGSSSASGGSEDNLTANATQNPAVGTADRAAFMKAVHAKLDPNLKGQANEYLVSWLQSGNGYTFMEAEVRGKGKAIDWKATSYKADVEGGLFDLNTDRAGNTHVFFSAMAKKNAAGGFDVVDMVVAPDDLTLAGTGIAAAPRSIFPIVVGEGGNGNGGNGNGGDGDGDGDGDGAPKTGNGG